MTAVTLMIVMKTIVIMDIDVYNNVKYNKDNDTDKEEDNITANIDNPKKTTNNDNNKKNFYSKNKINIYQFHHHNNCHTS